MVGLLINVVCLFMLNKTTIPYVSLLSEDIDLKLKPVVRRHHRYVVKWNNVEFATKALEISSTYMSFQFMIISERNI